jgi:hypothetical protein
MSKLPAVFKLLKEFQDTKLDNALKEFVGQSKVINLFKTSKLQVMRLKGENVVKKISNFILNV